MLDGTVTFDVDYMVFVAPNPQLKPKFFALVWPLTPTLWVFVFISLAVGTAVFTLVSNLESKAGRATSRREGTLLLTFQFRSSGRT